MTHRIRHRVARRLRFLADRIDRPGAPKHVSSISFTFEENVGLVVHGHGPIALRRHGDFETLPGCPLWYLGDDDYERAHTEGSA